MKDNNLQKRISLAKDILYSLKNILNKLQEASCNIEETSGSFFKKVFEENKSEVENEIIRYNTNLKEINRLNSEATQEINSWFDFSRSPDELKKLTFPIIFKIRKKRLKKVITKINKRISNLTIENRFIKEQLITWEKELESKALNRIKKDGKYSEYKSLLQAKDILVNELKYILATIPGLCPIEVDLTNIDKLISLLER